MNKGTKIIIALVVVVAIAVAAILFTRGDSGSNGSDTGNNEDSSNGSSQPFTSTITYDENGFSPAEITVSPGDSIRIVNETDADIEPASDPHPTHTINPELNAGDIAPGEDATITVETVGTWGYHNHHEPSNTGTITVE